MSFTKWFIRHFLLELIWHFFALSYESVHCKQRKSIGNCLKNGSICSVVFVFIIKSFQIIIILWPKLSIENDVCFVVLQLKQQKSKWKKHHRCIFGRNIWSSRTKNFENHKQLMVMVVGEFLISFFCSQSKNVFSGLVRLNDWMNDWEMRIRSGSTWKNIPATDPWMLNHSQTRLSLWIGV